MVNRSAVGSLKSVRRPSIPEKDFPEKPISVEVFNAASKSNDFFRCIYVHTPLSLVTDTMLEVLSVRVHTITKEEFLTAWQANAAMAAMILSLNAVLELDICRLTSLTAFI